MGGSRWSASDWDSYKTTTVDTAATTASLYSSRTIKSTGSHKTTMDPKGIVLRESRDSAANPNSTPIIIALDGTGSMGMVADKIMRHLGTFMDELLNRKVISDPHVMFMGIGDVDHSSGKNGAAFWGDSAPLQVTQFEADIRIAEQLKDIYLEHGGGGNSTESYNLAWYFAAYHTTSDAFEKRNKKGYLFTIGDEETPYDLNKHHITKIMGKDPEFETLSNEDLLTAVRQKYNVYHIVAEEGSHCRRHAGSDRVISGWKEFLGSNVIALSDHTKIAEVIISAIQVAEGVDTDTVSKSWSGDTSLVVARAVRDLAKTSESGRGVVRL